MNILHVDVDEYLESLLTEGEKSTLSLTPQTVSQFKDAENIEILTFKSQSRITRDVIEAFPKLKALIARTVGVDNIDLDTCKELGIAVYYIPDYGAYNIAEHALGLILAGARNIVRANKEVHKGIFSHKQFQGIVLRGKTIGIVGTGKIGLSLIELLQPFQVEILAYDVVENEEASFKLHFSYVPLETLLYNADIVSIHVPSLPETYHLIGENELRIMKDSVILVNTSRGVIVDTLALLKYIKKFKAVCLDVVEDEEHFNKDHPLLKFENVIITPHIAFFTDNSIRKIAEETIRCLEKFEKGDREGRVA